MRVTRKSASWMAAGICALSVLAILIWPRVESHWPGGTAGSALYAARLSVDYACHPHRDVGTTSPRRPM